MRRLLPLLGTLTACTGSATPAETPPPVAQRCQAVNRPAGVQFGANVNALFWEAHYDDSPLLSAVRSLGTPLLRLPGGTEADYYDWHAGRPVDPCRYGSCRTWDAAQLTPPALFQRFSSFANGTSQRFAAFVARVNGAPLLVANSMTASVDDNVRWLTAALGPAWPRARIELANEPYFGQVEGTDNTARLYPTAASHVSFSQQLAAALRAAIPDAVLGYPAFVPRIALTTGQVDAGHDARMLTWNEQVLASGIARHVDAFALHLYPRLTGRRGLSDPEYLRILAGVAETYWRGMRGTPQWQVLPPDKRLWITEMNASFADAPELVGTWMHALIQAQLTVLLLQDSRVDVVLQHMLTGNPQWQSIVHPGRDPDIAVAPGYTPYALTATGEMLAGIASALGGRTCVEAYATGSPGVVGVVARHTDARSALIVNATADSIRVNLRELGMTSAAVVQRSAPPLARIGAGASVTRVTSPVAAEGTVSIHPYALVSVLGSP